MEQKFTNTRRIWLCEARKKKGLSQAKAASIIGISLAYMIKLEHGQRTPSEVVAKMIGIVLDIDYKLFNL